MTRNYSYFLITLYFVITFSSCTISDPPEVFYSYYLHRYTNATSTEVCLSSSFLDNQNNYSFCILPDSSYTYGVANEANPFSKNNEIASSVIVRFLTSPDSCYVFDGVIDSSSNDIRLSSSYQSIYRVIPESHDSTYLHEEYKFTNELKSLATPCIEPFKRMD